MVARANSRDNAAGLKVLVVEDDADTAVSLANLLHLFGHQVRLADNGPAALAQAQELPPDVVLLDIGLPGMDGYEVATRLKSQAGEKAPLVVAITGRGRDEDRQRGCEAGIDLHWLKPVAPADLFHILARFQRVLAVDRNDACIEGRVPGAAS